MLYIPLTSIYTIRQSGIFSLCNRKSKRIYLGYGQNILVALNRIMEEIFVSKDLDYLEFTILETISDRDIMKRRHKELCDHYRKLGYSFYKEPIDIPLRICVDILVDYRNPSGLLAYATLVQKNNDKKVVGVFETMKEAQIFVAAYKKPFYPFYANNVLTRDFVSKYTT